MVSTGLSKSLSLGSNPGGPTMEYRKFFTHDSCYFRARHEDKVVQICEHVTTYLRNKKIFPNYETLLEKKLFEQLKRMIYDNV